MRKILIALVLCLLFIFGCVDASTYFDGYTQSVLYLNGTSNSTVITDEIGSIVPWTSSGIANISGSRKLFGSGSLFNSNDAGNTGYIKTSNSTFANFGTGDFTIEASIYPTAIRTASYSVIMCEPSGTENPSFMLYDSVGSGTSARLNFYDGTTRGGTAGIITFNRWWNISVVRHSGSLTLYVEGINNGTYADSGAIDFGAAYIGHDSTTALNDFRGYIDNVRVSNYARYTSNYVPTNVEWGNAGSEIDHSSVKLSPYPANITIFDRSNMTLDASEFIGAKSILVNVSYNKTALNITNVYLNSTTLPGNTLESTVYLANGFALINVTNSTGITAARNVSIANVQFEAINIANSTEPVNFNSGTYISNASEIKSISLLSPGRFQMSGPTIPFQANFTASNSSGLSPLYVQFNDTTIGYKVDVWNWSFGEGNFSSVQNPSNTYYTPGNFTVTLISTNSSYSVNSTASSVISVTSPSINASFSTNTTHGVYPVAVGFTDTSTALGTTIDAWNWSFGDGSYGITQSASHVYNSIGVYSTTLTARNISSDINSTSDIHLITVTGPSNVTRQNIRMSPSYSLTVIFTDSVTGSLVPNVAISDSLGYSQNVSTGSYSRTYGYSSVTIYYSADGYVPGSRTFSITNNLIETIVMTPTAKTSSYTQSVWWTPHTVQITVMDSVYQNRLPNIPINVTFNQSAIPTEWLNQMYGVQSATAQQMINSTLRLQGHTGSDGTLTTTLLGSLLYDIHMDLSVYGGSHDYFTQAYPSDNMLNLYVSISGKTLPISNLNQTHRLMASNVTEPNISYVTMWNYYQDPTGLTTSVNMSWKFANNNTPVYWYNISNPGTSLVSGSYTMQNTRGTQMRWQINATLSGN